MLKSHIVLLLSVIPLYLLALVTKEPAWFDGNGWMPPGAPKMGEAVYGDIDLAAPAVRSLICIVLAATARSLVLALSAVQAAEGAYVRATLLDCLLYHGLQPAIFLSLRGGVDWSHPGWVAFIGTHSAYGAGFTAAWLFAGSTEKAKRH